MPRASRTRRSTSPRPGGGVRHRGRSGGGRGGGAGGADVGAASGTPDRRRRARGRAHLAVEPDGERRRRGGGAARAARGPPRRLLAGRAGGASPGLRGVAGPRSRGLTGGRWRRARARDEGGGAPLGPRRGARRLERRRAPRRSGRGRRGRAASRCASSMRRARRPASSGRHEGVGGDRARAVERARALARGHGDVARAGRVRRDLEDLVEGLLARAASRAAPGRAATSSASSASAIAANARAAGDVRPLDEERAPRAHRAPHLVVVVDEPEVSPSRARSTSARRPPPPARRRRPARVRAWFTMSRGRNAASWRARFRPRLGVALRDRRDELHRALEACRRPSPTRSSASYPNTCATFRIRRQNAAFTNRYAFSTAVGSGTSTSTPWSETRKKSSTFACGARAEVEDGVVHVHLLHVAQEAASSGRGAGSRRRGGRARRRRGRGSRSPVGVTTSSMRSTLRSMKSESVRCGTSSAERGVEVRAAQVGVDEHDPLARAARARCRGSRR